MTVSIPAADLQYIIEYLRDDDESTSQRMRSYDLANFLDRQLLLSEKLGND